MQVSWNNEKSKKEGLKQLSEYRLGYLVELMKDDKEQLKQMLDTLTGDDKKVQAMLDELSS